MGILLAAFQALAKLFGFGEKAIAEVHDKNQRDAGAAAQRDADDKATLDTIVRVDAPITDADRERVWNKYAPKT